MTEVGHASGPPVDPTAPLHQLLVDEQAAQRREVGMTAADDPIDLRLRIPLAGLKFLRQPSQDRKPFLALGGNPEQATAAINEIRENAFVVRRFLKSHSR